MFLLKVLVESFVNCVVLDIHSA